MPRLPVKGEENELTKILELAADLTIQIDLELAEQFGIPLFTAAKGRGPSAYEWPETPEDLSPEEMQVLVNLHGEAAVKQWVMESAVRRMSESTMSPDGSDERPAY